MKKIFKRTLQTLVAAAIISGTYFGRHGDCPPFYSHKTKDSYGINVAVYTEIGPSASINGANVSLFTTNYGLINGGNFSGIVENHGTMNGLNVSITKGNYDVFTGTNVSLISMEDERSKTTGLNASIMDGNIGSIKGANVSLVNLGYYGSSVKGLELGLINAPMYSAGTSINGLALGVINHHNKLYGVQVGIYNESSDSKDETCDENKVNKGFLFNFNFNKNGGK